MPSRNRMLGVALVALVVVAGALLVSPGVRYWFVDPDPDPDGYETTTVTLADANGTALATVRVRIADTRDKRYLGLSDTRSLADGEGMLFVHAGEGTHAYVMRNMSFPLDIVFVDADGSVTTVHHAGVPPPDTTGSDLRRYSGRAKYVLEVPRGYTNRTGLDEGDRVEIPPTV